MNDDKPANLPPVSRLDFTRALAQSYPMEQSGDVKITVEQPGLPPITFGAFIQQGERVILVSGRFK